MVQKIKEKVGDLSGKVIAILGLSFKPNTNDIRESSAVAVAAGLLAMGARVRVYDPAAMEEALAACPGLECGADTYDTAKDCDALVLATEWNEFRRLDLPRVKSLMKCPVFVDLRNVYDPDQMKRLGFDYCGVGRG